MYVGSNFYIHAHLLQRTVIGLNIDVVVFKICVSAWHDCF